MGVSHFILFIRMMLNLGSSPKGIFYINEFGVKMKIGKVLLIILVTFLLSVGGVYAEDIEKNVTVVQSDLELDAIDESIDSHSVLADTSYVNNCNCSEYSTDTLRVNFTNNDVKISSNKLGLSNEIKNMSLILNGYNNLNDSKDDYLNVLNAGYSEDILNDDIVYDRTIIINNDFEDGNKPVNWDYSAVSIYSYAKYAKNGKKFLSIFEDGFVSQNINFNTIDFVSFWYMSESKNSIIKVLIDDEEFFEYKIANTGMGKWEMVLLNVSNITGFHSLKLIQKGGIGYVDYFNVIHNDDIYVNFTVDSYNLVGDNLTLSFSDHSYGLISGWLWDFGDGNISTNQNVTHLFKSGHYNISLCVFNQNTSKYAYYEIPISFPTIVRTGEEFNSVQKAINAANDGDTINIYNNIFYDKYIENIVVNKSLTLNFFNCTLVSDNVNPVITVNSGANVIVRNISFDSGVMIKTDNTSKLTIIESNIFEDIVLLEGNIELCDYNFVNIGIYIKNANCSLNYCNFTGSDVILNDGNLIINNCNFYYNDIGITQFNGKSSVKNSMLVNSSIGILIQGGKSIISNSTLFDNIEGVVIDSANVNIVSNFILNNGVGVNVTNSSSNITFNVIHSNDIGLIYNSCDIVNENNWWGNNQPTYIFGYIPNQTVDVCQLGGIESELSTWLILNISQSFNLDYNYWIVGKTYYNLTLDFTHNNFGEDVSDKGVIKDSIFTLNGNQDSHAIKNSRGECIFSFGYLTGHLNELNVTVANKEYVVPVINDTASPKVNHITPACIFDDGIVVEIECDDEDAVVFYTTDGSNPGYSSTRLVYSEPILINESTTFRYSVIDHYGNFQKELIDYTSYNGGGSTYTFYKKDVFAEIVGTSARINVDSYAYTLDGSNPKDSISANHYSHPFVVFGLSPVRFYGTQIKFYSIDFSLNYIKNSSFEDSDAIWSQYQGDNHNSGHSSYTGPLLNQSAWVNEQFSSSSSAVVDNKGHIYIGGDDGYLYCLNNQGLVIWRFGTNSKIICTPTIGPDGNIYFSNWMNSSAYCISPFGELIWKIHLDDYNTGTSPVFGLDNRLYLITSADTYSTIFVIDNGTLISNHSLPLISGSTPVVGSDGTLYLVSTDHELVCVNWDGSLRRASFIDSGSNFKDFTKQNQHISVNIGSNGIVYVTNYVRSVKILNSYLTSEEISKYSQMEMYSELIDELVANGTFGGSSDSFNFYYFYFYAINAYYPNGTLKWTNIDYNIDVSGTPTYFDDVLYVAGNNALYAFNATNGKPIWTESIKSTGLTESSPLISRDGVIYVTSNNIVYAFSLKGDRIWEYELINEMYGNPIIFATPTLTNDKTLIVTSNQGIFAFNDVAADFSYYHIDGTAGTLQFIDQSTKGDNLYYWMFGDGNISREQNPIHEYAKGGKYFVTLLVYHDNMTLVRNMTVYVKFKDIVPPSNVTVFINNSITFGGVFNYTQYVKLNASDESGGVTIYYTLDGSNPINSTNRRVYNGLIDIEVDCVLNVVALDESGNYGNVSSITFNIADSVNVRNLTNSSLVDDIQALLDAAEPGSKILFDYVLVEGANFTINKPLNLISNINTQLVGNGVQPVFTFTENATGSILNGFVINNVDELGIFINNTSDVTVRECIVNVTNSTGIYIFDCDNITVKYAHVVDADEGIIVNQSSSTKLDHVNVYDCYSDGIWVYKSSDTYITNSTIEGNGKDPFKLGFNSFEIDQYGRAHFVVNMPASESRANNLLIEDSKGTFILNNTINGGFFGVHLYHDNFDVLIDKNTFNNTVGDAILLANYFDGINITHNAIRECFNGVNFMGYSQDVYIANNLIDRLHDHPGSIYDPGNPYLVLDTLEDVAGYVYEYYFPHDTLFNHYGNGIQVSRGARNFHEGNTVIIDNVIIRLAHRAWESRKAVCYIDASCEGYGYNLFDGSYSLIGLGGATQYHEGRVDLVVDRIGDATFRLRLINRLDGHYLSEIPKFDLTFNVGGFTQTVYFEGGEAIATFDVAMALSDVEAVISNEVRKSAHFNIEITEGYTSSNRDYDPGLEKGDAWDNPDPVIPSFPFEDNPTPSYPEVPDTPIDTGSGSGNGSGNGDGNGNGLFDGNGNGSAFGQGDGTHGSSNTNIKGREGQTVDNLNDLAESFVGDLDPIGVDSAAQGSDVSIEGESSGGEGETAKAYEVTKQINAEKINQFGFVFVIIFALIATIVGYVKKKYFEGGQL